MYKNQKGFINILLIVLIVVLVGLAGYFALNNQGTQNPYSSSTSQTYTSTSSSSSLIPTPAICDYAAPPQGCNYVSGPNYDPVTSCGMILSCPNK